MGKMANAGKMLSAKKLRLDPKWSFQSLLYCWYVSIFSEEVKYIILMAKEKLNGRVVVGQKQFLNFTIITFQQYLSIFII